MVYDFGLTIETSKMMDTLTEEEAVTRWDEIIERAINGEEIIITHKGKPIAKLVPAEDSDQIEQVKVPA